MTARQALEKKARVLGLISGLSVLCWLLFTFVTDSHSFSAFLFIPFAVLIASLAALAFSLRCPKCNANLGFLFNRSSFSGHRLTHFCPSCGANLDEHSP
jgi:hypothetical protein